MTYDPNVFGYVDGQPTYSRDEFIYKKRRRGPITDDAELVAFAEKVTSGWYNAGWRRTFTTYYLGDYSIRSMLVALPGRLAVDVSSAASPAEASEIIRAEVYKILEELAGYKYDPEVYARRVRDREGWSELSDDADD